MSIAPPSLLSRLEQYALSFRRSTRAIQSVLPGLFLTDDDAMALLDLDVNDMGRHIAFFGPGWNRFPWHSLAGPTGLAFTIHNGGPPLIFPGVTTITYQTFPSYSFMRVVPSLAHPALVGARSIEEANGVYFSSVVNHGHADQQVIFVVNLAWIVSPGSVASTPVTVFEGDVLRYGCLWVGYNACTLNWVSQFDIRRIAVGRRVDPARHPNVGTLPRLPGVRLEAVAPREWSFLPFQGKFL